MEELIGAIEEMMEEAVPEEEIGGGPSGIAETLSELLGRFQSAKNYRMQYDEFGKRCFSLYRVHQKQAVEGRSNLHIPRTYEQIDTLRARLVKSFTSQRPYVEFIPKVNPNMDMKSLEDNVSKANIACSLVDMQLETNNFKSKFYDFITSLMIYPIAVMGVGWRYDERLVRRKEHMQIPLLDPSGMPHIGPDGMPLAQTMVQITEQPEIVFDDNELINIDFYDFWPDPRGYDLDSCRYVFHREWLSRQDIEEKIMVLAEANGGYLFEIDWDEMSSASGGEDGRRERQSEIGFTIDDTQDESPQMQLYEVLNYWEDDRYAMIINQSEVAYDGPNPYWRHMAKPFVVASYEPLPNEFYGMSAVELIADLQEEVNTHRNQRIDNVSLVMNKMFKVRRSADIDESDLVFRPGGIVYVDSFDDIMEFQVTDVTGSSYNEEQLVKLDMENTLGVPSVVRGVDSARRETATEIVTKASNAGIRFDVKIMLFETLGFKRLARLMDMNNQQFIDDDRLVHLVGPLGAEEWRQIDPTEIVGEFDYRPAGPAIDPVANKELRRQQLTGLMEIAISTQNPYIDMYELTKTLLESFDLRNVEKLLKTQEELQQEMMQQQLMMAMQEQQMQGGGHGIQPEQLTNQMQGGQMDPALMQRLGGQGR